MIGENVTCRVLGDHDCSIGFYVTNEAASYIGKAFNTGGYIGVFRQYGLFVEAQPSGAQTSAVLKNNGNGINLSLITTEKMVPGNGVLAVTDNTSTTRAEW